MCVSHLLCCACGSSGWTAAAWPDKRSPLPQWQADGSLAVLSITNDVLIQQPVYWGILSGSENQLTEVVAPLSLRVGANQGRCSLLSVALTGGVTLVPWHTQRKWSPGLRMVYKMGRNVVEWRAFVLVKCVCKII